MKKTLLLIVCLLAGLSLSAQNRKVNIVKAEASSSQQGVNASLVIDGDYNTIWHTPYDRNQGSSTKFPVDLILTFEETTHVGFMRYIPRQDGDYFSGNWQGDVFISYCPTTTGTNFKNVGVYQLSGDASIYDFPLGEEGIECGQIKFTLTYGFFNYASAAEIEAYTFDNIKKEEIEPYFTDNIFTQLKPEVTSSEGIENKVVKELVDNLLSDAEKYRKFRVGEYEPYLPTETLQNILKSSNYYNKYENPTGVYLKAGESCWIAVDGITGDYNVGLTVKNWVTNEKSSYYSLRNGLNYITTSNEGNVFVSYYTDDFENAPNVNIHFINAPVQGYWDQATMTNEDWIELLKGRTSKDNTILITRSEHAQLAFPVSAWVKYCPTNIDSTMTLYQQVQWAQRDILGLEKYGRQVKNRQLFFATTTGFMAAVNEGSYCNVEHLEAIMVPDAKRFDFWGVGHEWGHNNQVTTGFKWSGCGETTNNIFASWGQIHFTGNPHYLRLEDEVSGVGEYSDMRGGRMQTYFEEGLRKGVPWQLQDGPDYYGTTPTEKSVWGYDADGNYLGYVTTTSRNYDHFVKLAPFWQLNLWGTLAGKCPDIIPMVIESIRSTTNYTHYYNTNGQKQINWMKLACDSAKIDLLPFFEKAGMLRPINAYIEDYNAGWNVINEAMIDNLKAYVKEQGYPAYTEEINYINGHNYHIYRDCLKLDVPEALGEGCKLNGNKVTVQHSAVKNAVAFETYNSKGKLVRITMYGLGSDDNHSYTQVLYPKSSDATLSAAYIMAVGYDGERIKIYEEGGLKEKFFELMEQAKLYSSRVDTTGMKIGFLELEYANELTSFIAQMDSLVEQTDERNRPYGTWIAEMEATISSLAAHCIPMTPNRNYSIASSVNANQYIGTTTDGLNIHTYQDEEKPQSLIWRFVSTDTVGQYYIQQLSTGLYITSADDGKIIKTLSRDTAEAISFTVSIVVPGELYIQRADNDKVKLYLNDNLVYAGKKTNTNAKWLIQMENQSEKDMLSLPTASTDESLTLYYLLRADNGEYAYSYIPNSPRDRGRIATNIYENPEDLNYWFYFKQGSQNGCYTIHNLETDKVVTVDNNKLFINKDTEKAPEFAIALNEQGTGFTISNEAGYWHMQQGSIGDLIILSTEANTPWRLQCIRTISLTDEPLTSLTLNTAEHTLLEGDSIVLTAVTAPKYATDHSVTWSSSDESIATVDSTGKVKAIAAGIATITATANDNSGLAATCKVTVQKNESGVFTEAAPALSVRCQGGTVIINGLAKGTTVSVYNIVGKPIATTTANDSFVAINTGLAKGNTLIVKVAEYTFKLQTK